MTALVEILRRVEGLSGPDREVDFDLCIALNYAGPLDHEPHGLRRADWNAEDDPEELHYEDDQGEPCTSETPELTASIDCALGLVKRVLPGWWWKVGSCHVSDDACIGPDWNDPEHAERLKAEFGHLLVSGSEWDSGFDIDRRPSGNVALALIEALLRALIAIEEARAPADEVAG